MRTTSPNQSAKLHQASTKRITDPHLPARQLLANSIWTMSPTQREKEVNSPENITGFSTVKDQILKWSAEYYDKLYPKKDHYGTETTTLSKESDLVLSSTERNAISRDKFSPVPFDLYRITKVDLDSIKYEFEPSLMTFIRSPDCARHYTRVSESCSRRLP
jgi:hypothetical protein